MSYDRTERISQNGNDEKTAFPGIYAAASAVAQGVLESVQALAGTTYCKGVQISELAKWAKEYGCWFEITQLGEFVDRGSEK